LALFGDESRALRASLIEADEAQSNRDGQTPKNDAR
jgi:hypothetical protein